MTITRTFDVTFVVRDERGNPEMNGICNSRPLTWQEALQMFGIIHSDRNLWPDRLLTIDKGWTVEFDYEESDQSNRNLESLKNAWNKGPASRSAANRATGR